MKNIKHIRGNELKLDQEEVAKLLSISQPTLSRIENDKLFGKNYKKYLEFLKKKGVDLNRLF
ncbi:MAG: helix-turn-helix transcriptional regulator [Algibacter sp.]